MKKLSHMKVGVAKYRDDAIIFAIKIPTGTLKTDKKLIIPITNSNKKQIDEEIEYIVKINNQIFTFQTGLSLQELKLSKHCIVKKNCKLVSNTKEEIIEIENDFVILNNVKNKNFKSTCDERKFILNGNFIINFVNCSVKIDNKIFRNKFTEFTERFVLQNKENISLSDEALVFEKINFHQENNIKEIKELKLHKIVNYSLGASSFILILIILLIIIVTFYKRKTKKIRIIQENHYSKEGGVTFPQFSSRHPETCQHNVTNTHVTSRETIRPELFQLCENMKIATKNA